MFRRWLGAAADRKREIVVLASVLGLSGADTATVGATATQLRHALGIGNTQIGLLVTVTSLVAALATVPFGVLADRVRRTWTLGGAIAFWGGAMIWSATADSFGTLLLARVFLGTVTAAAGPLVASLVGDYFPANDRGRVYGVILTGELAGAGVGFAVTGDIAALSWRAAFAFLAVPAFVLAWMVFRLPEPERGGSGTPTGEQADTARPTVAQRLVREAGVRSDPELVLRGDLRHMGLFAVVRYVLRVRTNVILIAASACGYYFIAGIQTFGIEFARRSYGLGQAPANALLLLVGIGALLGTLAGGLAGDELLRRRHPTGRVLVSAVSAALATALFVPALFAQTALAALPYLIVAAFALSAQNPPLDAARLDIMPPALWGRAESIRTVLRSIAQALAPLLFGAVADHIFGGGRTSLQWTFVVMLLPLAGSAALLFRALRTYPGDVAAAAASSSNG